MVETLGVESHHHLVSDHDGWGGTAAIFINQFLHRGLITADIAVFVRDSSLREVGLYCLARWSAGLGEDDDFLFEHRFEIRAIYDLQGTIADVQLPISNLFDDKMLLVTPRNRIQPPYFPAYSISKLILTVCRSIAETEQYFSSESRTASSTAL